MKQSLKLLLYGADTPHDRTFAVDRPGPRNDWVVLCFRTPFLIRTDSGLETGQPGDCIVHDPSQNGTRLCLVSVQVFATTGFMLLG